MKIKKRHIFVLVLLIILGTFIVYGLSKYGNKSQKSEPSGKKILYYRNPMDPAITSPVPMKDSMGMDYVPVYAQEENKTNIYISPEKQQLIGISTTAVEKTDMKKEIQTVGTVAYDPQLYIAQEEYIQALKLKDLAKSNEILSAAEKKLLVMGMSDEEIKQLKKEGSPQENLFLGYGHKNIWIYVNIYEEDIATIKPGLPVEIRTIAYPGEVFKGRIVSISPVIDPQSRSEKARVELGNPANKLKPGMYVDAKIIVSLGKKITLPESAIIFTGERNIVFIAKGDGYFAGREVKLGEKADGYYEVLSELQEGDVIVKEGTFFVDSESKLKSGM